MKKLLTLLTIFLFNFLPAQTVNYITNNVDIANPERGLYYHTSTESGSYTLLNQTTLINNRLNNNITLILRVFYLEDFRNSPISATYLTNIQTDLNRCRNARIKVIIRFAYNDGGFSGDDDAPKAVVLNHISQLSPIMNLNQDVISCVQMGFIGRWGEGYYSTYYGNNGVLSVTNISDRNEVLMSILNSFPRQIQVRTPLLKQRLVGTIANANTRIGHHNDSFLSSNSEQGTYNNVPLERLYVQQESDFVVVGGECNEFPTAYTNCTTALTDLFKYSWNYLNSVGYASGLINHWQTNGCYDEIKRRLGYRFELVSSTLSGNNLNIKIRNTGFGHVINPRPIRLVLKNTITNAVSYVDISSDTRTWLKNTTIELNTAISVSNGSYKLYLFSPDEFNNFPEYAIRFANDNVWDATTGYNDLNQTYVTSCANSTTWNGISWSAGAPNITTTAIINAPYTVNGIAPTVNFDCCNLVVNSTLQINNNRFVSFQYDVSGAGNIVVKSGGKLIPVNDFSTCSSTNISVERTTSLLKKYDYVYFSSPTKNTIIGNTLSNWYADRTFSFNGQYFIDLETNYQGNLISNIPDGQDDADPSPWITSNFTDTFISGLGYPSMILNGTFPRTETVAFQGCLNTGVVTTPLIISGNPTALLYNPNIVGNPYSSSILADSFIIDNLPNISGTLYFWAHTNSLSSSYSGLEQLNFIKGDYSSYNLSGGISSSFGGLTPNGFIPSCQGFLVYAEVPNTSLVFKPSYMVVGYPNSGNFYRSSPFTRYRLNLLDNEVSDGLFKQILVNYNSDTSLDFDKGWDSKVSVYNEPLKFYTLGDYEIESRGDFDIEDVVPLGYSTVVSSNYVMSINSMEGINQIYLLDTYTGDFVDLFFGYSFYSEVGKFDDRFKIYYTNSLAVNSYKTEGFKIIPNPSENIFTIYFDNSKISSIFVLDMYGRTIRAKVSSLKNKIIVDLSDVSSGAYIIRLNNTNLKLIKK